MPYSHMVESNHHQPENGKVGIDEGPAKQFLVRRSKKLPFWLWVAIAHSLGIKTRPGERAVVATLLYTLTVISALVLVGTTTAFVAAGVIHSHFPGARSVASPNATDHGVDAMDGIVMITLNVFWCLLGHYAKNLAHRLYSSTKFLDMVRLHAKTVLKVNAAFVFFLLSTTFVIVHNVQAYDTWYARPSTCTSVGTSPILCQIRFVSLCVFSVFAILWNSLVGLVLLSVCRTNTMGIRKFIQDLEKDAMVYERQRFGPNAAVSDLVWLSDNDVDQSFEGDTEPHSNQHRFASIVSTTTNNNDVPTGPVSVNVELTPKSQPSPPILTVGGRMNATPMQLLNVSPLPGCATPSPAYCNLREDKDRIQPMSTALILQRYWKLSCSTRLSSSTFQRWTTCVKTLCLAWVAIGLVQWLSATPQPIQVIQVIIPLMILPLLCAAYAEVNVEGKRLLKCICPMEQRLTALYVMWKCPPQMTVFGMTITYGAMGTAAAGLLLALVSRVVLKQLGAGSSR